MKLPAGKYFVGDLCYVMHDEWTEVCDLLFGPNDSLDGGVYKLKDGRQFALYPTKYGDGEYRSNIGTSHGVDAGVIGCILVSDIRDNTYSDIEDLGAVVEFKQPFETGEHKGVISFGHVRINTDYSDEDGEDE